MTKKRLNTPTPAFHPNYRERLILLWALAETALGGFLHAFKIPLTGFVVGGFSVLTIGLLARFSSGSSWRSILTATTLVILAKAALSPQSPPTAYLAVAFQGVCGAICFQTLPYRVATLTFGMFALAESALQKVLVLSLIFGTNLWLAMEQSASSLVKWFGINSSVSALSIIIGFTGFYALWGLILGYALWHLPNQIAKRRILFHPLTPASPVGIPTSVKPLIRRPTWFLLPFIVLLIAFALGGAGVWATATRIFLRAIAVTAILFLIVGPVFKWLLESWTARQSKMHQDSLQGLLSQLRTLPLVVQEIWQRAGRDHQKMRRLVEWVLGMFYWAIYSVPKVSLLIGPIRSGKTSALKIWCSDRIDIGGFLTPDGQDGLRKLHILPSHATCERVFEIPESGTESVTVGRFHFSFEAFNAGKAAMSAAFENSDCKYLVVDEVGKLELQNTGWEPELSQWIARANVGDFDKQLILVVREDLRSEVQLRYGLEHAWILTKADFV